MKNILLSSLIVLTLLNSNAYASSDVDNSLEAFSKAYGVELLKYEIVDYFNKNPELLLSNDPLIGSKALNLMSKLLAVGTLADPDSNDKQKFYAGLHLILTPDLTTTLILTSIQLADSLLSLEHEKTILKIKEQTQKYMLESYSLKQQVYNSEYYYLTSRLESLIELINRHTALRKEIGLKSISGGDELEINSILSKFVELNSIVSQLKKQQHFLESLKEFSNKPEDVLSVELTVNDIVKRDEKVLKQLLTDIKSMWASVRHIAVIKMMNKKFETHNNKIYVFNRCANLINKMHTTSITDQEFIVVNDCFTKFTELKNENI